MKCNNLIKYGWKGEITYNRKDEPKLLFGISDDFPLSFYRIGKESFEVSRKMLENMDDNLFKSEALFLNRSWITKDGLKICDGNIIASSTVEGDYNYEGLGWVTIEYTCDKCKAPFINKDIEHTPFLTLPVDEETLNKFLTKYIKEL